MAEALSRMPRANLRFLQLSSERGGGGALRAAQVVQPQLQLRFQAPRQLVVVRVLPVQHLLLHPVVRDVGRQQRLVTSLPGVWQHSGTTSYWHQI